MGSVIGFDAFHLADTLLTQPLQIIVGSKQGAFGSYKDGHELYEKAASEKKIYLLWKVRVITIYTTNQNQ